jgi:flavin reductase (DIM6/NTAB) family NADH-FMN oxidoreductase RutF
MGSFATGVTIVTCEVDGGVHGATVNSFTSVSLNPPLVLASLAKSSKASRYLRGRPFTVNILSAEQEEHALHFAGRPQAALETRFGKEDVAPRIEGCMAYVFCRPWRVHEAGDHDLILGEVVGVEAVPESAQAQPLVFYRGGFWRLGTSSHAA